MKSKTKACRRDETVVAILLLHHPKLSGLLLRVSFHDGAMGVFMPMESKLQFNGSHGNLKIEVNDSNYAQSYC